MNPDLRIQILGKEDFDADPRWLGPVATATVLRDVPQCPNGLIHPTLRPNDAQCLQCVCHYEWPLGASTSK